MKEKLSYYWSNREKLLKNAWDKYQNKGGKQKAAKYYRKNVDLIRLEVKNKYKNLSEKEKNKKRNYQRERCHMKKKLLCFQKIKNKEIIYFYSIKDECTDIKIW